jgi:ATP-dependent DNA helicase RecG
MVEIFDDRVDIVSPGGVCKGITPENFGTISITRNSNVASMLHHRRYIEQMGTGIKRMLNAAREAQVIEPEFELTGFFKVTFKRNESENPTDPNRSQTVVNDNNRSHPVTTGRIRSSRPIESIWLCYFLKKTIKQK